MSFMNSAELRKTLLAISVIFVALYRVGDTTHAIALDQVMLRHREFEFELWIPEGPHVLRVTSTSGVIKIDVEHDSTEFRLHRADVQ